MLKSVQNFVCPYEALYRFASSGTIMSEVQTLEEYHKIRDEKIIDGYLRNNFVEQNNHIPKDIMHLLLMFYHASRKETFKYFNPMIYQLSNDNMTVRAQYHLSFW